MFYSVLVSRAALFDISSMAASYIAIIMVHWRFLALLDGPAFPSLFSFSFFLAMRRPGIPTYSPPWIVLGLVYSCVRAGSCWNSAAVGGVQEGVACSAHLNLCRRHRVLVDCYPRRAVHHRVVFERCRFVSKHRPNRRTSTRMHMHMHMHMHKQCHTRVARVFGVNIQQGVEQNPDSWGSTRPASIARRRSTQRLHEKKMET